MRGAGRGRALSLPPHSAAAACLRLRCAPQDRISPYTVLMPKLACVYGLPAQLKWLKQEVRGKEGGGRGRWLSASGTGTLNAHARQCFMVLPAFAARMRTDVRSVILPPCAQMYAA